MPPAVSLQYIKAMCQKENPPLWTRYEHIRALTFGCVMTWDENYWAQEQLEGIGGETVRQSKRGLALAKNPSDFTPIFVEERYVPKPSGGAGKRRTEAAQLEVLGKLQRAYNIMWKSTYIDKNKKGKRVGRWFREQLMKEPSGKSGMFMRTPWLEKNIEPHIWQKDSRATRQLRYCSISSPTRS